MRKKRYVVLTLALCAASAALAAFMTYDLVRGWPKPSASQPDQGLIEELAALRAEASDLRKQLADLEADRAREAEERSLAEAKAAAEAEAVPKLPPPPYPLWNQRSVEEWAGQALFRYRVAEEQGRAGPMILVEILTMAFQYGQLAEEDAETLRRFAGETVVDVPASDEDFRAFVFFCPSLWSIGQILAGDAPGDLGKADLGPLTIAHHLAHLPTHTVRPYLPQLREMARRMAESEHSASAGPVIGALAWAHSDSEGYAFLTRYRDKAPLMREAIRYAAWLGNGASRRFLEQAAARHPSAETRAEAENQLQIWDQVTSEIRGTNASGPSEPPPVR